MEIGRRGTKLRSILPVIGKSATRLLGITSQITVLPVIVHRVTALRIARR
jgi:hypothetical protein